MSSEPPEEPHYQSEASILSPASPKPVYFPTPTNIPVLEMQMDVGFNQTEAHMADPAMHNTDVRPDFWRDPHEKTVAVEEVEDGGVEDHASPFSTGGGDAMETMEMGEEAADSKETAVPAEDPERTQLSSNSASHDANGSLAAMEPAQETQPTDSNIFQPSSDPSVPSAGAPALASSDIYQTLSNPETQIEQNPIATQTFNGGAVDVQALLDTLQTAPSNTSTTAQANTAPLADSMTVATTHAPSSQSQANAATTPAPPGVEGVSASSPLSASALGVPPSGLPPRPPPQEQPLIHPNYVHSQHIRDYHPHAAHPAFQPQHARTGSQGNIADPTSRNYVPPVHSPTSAGLPAVPTAVGGSSYASTTPAGSYPAAAAAPPSYPGAPGVANGATGSLVVSDPMMGGSNFTASPTTHTTFPPGSGGGSGQNPYDFSPSSTTYPPSIESRREYKLREGAQPQPEDRPWDAEVQRKYDRFIEDERRYVSEGRWEQFPQGSRLFVGNLSSEKVTKRDIFHVFHTYGELAQISIKQAYGFVQFLRTEDCVRALEREQGTQIRDKRIHLEVSKPQKNRPQNQARRSRSPPDSGGRGRAGVNVDRYVSSGRGGNGRNGGGGGRDGYRPGYRSPSPRGYRDRYDDRYRTRSRSPAYGRGGGGGGGGGGRFRSPSPRRDVDDDLPLPRRAPRDVPDIQILVLDTLDRDFISWVEKAFSARAVRVDVLLLSPRLSEQAVVRRQILEGVVGVSKLTRQNQNSGKIGLQIFDRRAGVGNVQFEEYDNLDPGICAELVLRAKSTHAPPTPAASASAVGGYGGYGGQQQQYAAPSMPPQQQQQYGSYPPPQPPANYGHQPPPTPSYPPVYGAQPAQHAPPPPPGVPPNLQNLITNMDAGNLQHLLSAMNHGGGGGNSATPQSAQSGQHHGMYGGGGVGGSQPSSAGVVAQQLQNHPALAGYLSQQGQGQVLPGGGSGGGVGGAGAGAGAGGGGGVGGVNMQEILARLGNYRQ